MIQSAKQKYIQCSQCQKLVIRSQISRHLKYVHPNIYQSRISKANGCCDICDKPISSKNMARHIKQKHQHEHEKYVNELNISAFTNLENRRKNWLVRNKNINKQKELKIHSKNKKILKKEFNCEYNFSNFYLKDFNTTNKCLKMLALGKHDSNLIEEMMKQETNPPIIIKKHLKIDGYGCFASRDIKKDELISSYSGCVLTQQQIQRRQIAPNYIMALTDASQTLKSWSICPYLWSSFGVFFNCGVENNNIKTLMCLACTHIFILMKASKDISKGDELFYNYNGRLREYETKNFQQL